MGPFNSNDMRDNQYSLRPGTVWYLRHNKRFRVKITRLVGKAVHIEHLTQRKGARLQIVNSYGFLQVYKPVAIDV